MADAGDFVVEGYERQEEEPLPTTPEINVGTGYGDNTSLKKYIESLITKGVIREGTGVMDTGVRMYVPASTSTLRNIQRLSVDEFKAKLVGVGVAESEL